MGQEIVNREIAAQNETAPSLEETLLPNVSVQKNRPRSHDKTTPPKAHPLFAQFVSLVTSVAIQVAQLLRDVRHAEMHQVVLQGMDFTGNFHMRMDLAFVPAAFIATKKSGLIIRIDSGMSNPTSQDMIFARQTKRFYGRNRVGQNLFDLGAQTCFQDFVTIDLQNPFVSALW